MVDDSGAKGLHFFIGWSRKVRKVECVQKAEISEESKPCSMAKAELLGGLQEVRSEEQVIRDYKDFGFYSEEEEHWKVMSRGLTWQTWVYKGSSVFVFRIDWSETVVDSGPLIGGYWSNSGTRGLHLRDCHGESEKW